MTHYIIVTGGVISGVGKGVTTASLGKIFKEYGYTTTLIKIDPYINYDAGTLRPTEHGEVWVTYDGGEIDQDLGTYERFINQDLPRTNSITTGQIYSEVIAKERQGMYLGQTVQFIPHIIDQIKERIEQAAHGYDIAIIEIGGTVGDYENVPFLHVAKLLERTLGQNRVAHVLVTYLPIPAHVQEMKTKPTQQAIRLLGQEGIIPDFIICRAERPLDPPRKKKIEHVAHISSENVISAPDIDTIYQIPLDLEAEEVGKKLIKYFNLQSPAHVDWKVWSELVHAIRFPTTRVTIAVVGKYLATGDYQLSDSYLSISHALIHAGAHARVAVDIQWIDASQLENAHTIDALLGHVNGIIVPGGFGTAGVEGKIKAIEYARTRKVPYLGICYGMQLAVIEFARNVIGLSQAHTTEVDLHTDHPVVDILPLQKQLLEEKSLGGTMRLGNYYASIMPHSHVYKLYHAAGRVDNGAIVERHRHRYEVNPAYIDQLSTHGLIISGTHTREDGTKLVEFIELEEHPFFIATQAHPEFTSRFETSHPLFSEFVLQAYQRQVKSSVFEHKKSHTPSVAL